MEGIDPETSEVVEVEKRKEMVRNGVKVKASSPGRGRRKKEDKNTHHYVIDGTGKKLWVPKGTNPDHLPVTIYPYSQTTCDHILQLVTEGKTIQEIGLTEGLPPAHIIHKWLRLHPEFKAGMKQAKEARAEFFADKVIEIANQGTVHHKDVPFEKLKADIYKWGASVGDAEQYGSRTKVVGDPNAPVAFTIVTGVPEPDPAPREVESEVNE
jgi:hypothetical protein